MANNIWSNYTEKTATPVDADEVMVRDSTDGKNKRLLFGTFWKWVAKKLNEATISELETENKTIIGAINALNSDTLKANTINHKSFDLNYYTATGLYDTRGTLPSTIGMKNYPTDITASIIVLSTTYIVTQIYIAHNAASLYLRCKYQGHEFSEWKSVQLI